MPRLERTQRGWTYGDTLLKAVCNIEDLKQRELHEYPDNPAYSDYFLTTDEWRLRVKVCRVRHVERNENAWHLQTLRNSDSVIYVMSGAGEALLERDRWVPVRTGDLVYSSAGVPHGIRVSESGNELWYLSVEGPGPLTIGDVDGRPHSVVGNGPPSDRKH
jgi:mannose-6-phosphate isomerase-like protein (cupin superfamily)